jgi:Haem-degrading
VFFPGALPLYRNGALVGGLGVSGDGVDQDDFVTAGGAALMTLNNASQADQTGQGFEAPTAIRADQVVIDNVRLPYIKFPRNPTQ